MPDAHRNFAYAAVATPPAPATTGTSLVVGAGEGTRFPATPFNATVWPASAIPTPDNAEIVRVTNVAVDTLTIVREQEGTTARAIEAGDQLAATITVKTLTDIEGLSAASISVAGLSTPTYGQLQAIHNLTRAAGHLSGGAITPDGANINVAAGQGFIRAVDDDTATLLAFDWAAAGPLAIPTNSLRYVRVNYGTPATVTVSATEDYDYRTSFPLGFVVNEADTLYINDTPHSIGRGVGRLVRRHAEVEGRSRAHAIGGLTLGLVATANVSISAGVTWLRGVRDSFDEFDSSGLTDRFDRYYRSAAPPLWTREAAVAVVPDGLFDNTATLGTLGEVSQNNYGVYWFFLGPANGILMVYGRGDYNSLAVAQASQPPGDLPLRLQVGSLLLGRFIQRRTAGPTFTVVQVDSAFSTTFLAAPVADHGTLAGLAGDDHPQYALSEAVSTREAALSARIDTASAAVSVLSLAVSVADAHASAASAAAASADAHAAAASAAATSADGHAAAASAAVSVLSLAVSVADAHASAASAAATSADAHANAASAAASVASAAVSVLSLAVSVADAHASAASAAATSADAHAQAASAAASIASAAVSVLSLAVSVADAHASAASAAATSADAHANAASAAVSVLSLAVSVADAHASAASAAASAASVAVSVLSVAMSVLSVAVSVRDADLSNKVSAASALASVADAHASTASLAATSADAHANAASAAASVASVAVSILSVAVSVRDADLSNKVSAASALASVADAHASTASLAATSADAHANAASLAASVASVAVSVLSIAVSVRDAALSARIDAIPGGGSVPPTRIVQNIQTISATALTNISGLSISVSTGPVYRLEAMVIHNQGTAQPRRYGLTFPAMTRARGMIEASQSQVQGGLLLTAKMYQAPWDGDSGASVILSAASVVYLSGYAQYLGVMKPAAGGVVQLQMYTSSGAGAVQILDGSYIRLHKIG